MDDPLDLARVLIAEDDRTSLRVLQRQVSSLGYDVRCAADGAEAWELLQEESAHILLTDWSMPEVDGLELVDRARRVPWPPYIIMISALESQEDKLRALDLGVDEFLTKPVDFTELRSRLGVASRIVRLQQEIIDYAHTDQLTGLRGRRAFHDDVASEIARMNRYNGEPVLFYIDVNDFKSINERFGHDAGDLALVAVARFLRRTVRTSDRVYRIAGDEFAILAPQADPVRLTERLNRSIDVRIGGRDVQLTVSIGHHKLDKTSSAGAAIRAADEAMFRKKREYHRVVDTDHHCCREA